jgi:uncharacterized protein YndB with AHSA1/START domain
MKRPQFLPLFLALAGSSSLGAQERQIRIPLTVAATPERVWSLWTTNEGVRSFFAPGSRIELVVDGPYEIFFDPSAPAGKKGADGMRILAIEPNRRIVFTWNAPEHMPYVRAQRTIVSIELSPVGRDSTHVVLRHTGWGTGAEWDAAIKYFDGAWNGFVMPLLKHRIEHGPVNWAAMPKLAPIRPTTTIETLVTASR